MRRGIDKAVRATVLAQSALVWSCDKVDAVTWIEDGIFFERGRPVELSAEQEAKVVEYERRIAAAGRFVMPEE
jgi:hypothetical protein